MSLEIIRGFNRNQQAVESLILSLKSCVSGTLYLGYPILSSANSSQTVEALLLSKEYGIIAFSFEAIDAENRQDEIFYLLEGHLRKSDLLREGRKLIIEPVVISFLPTANIPLSQNQCLFAGPDTILELMQKHRKPISPEVFTKLSAVIQQVQNLKPDKKRNNLQKSDSKGSILKKLEKEIANLDQWQNKAAIETCDGPQRIRGLAGSGKTVVLALKAAYLHALYPDWNIAVTFSTRSLHQQFKDLIERFTFEQSGDRPNYEKLHILHTWGSFREAGMYSTIAEDYKIVPMDFTSAKSRYGGGNNAFAGICNDLMSMIRHRNERREQFDLVLIDEAQDLPLSFMQLVYSVTKSPKRIVWAYDELQNLYNESMPSVEDMFGKKRDGSPLVSLHNSDHSPRQDIALPVCYRNTPWALTIAHALGFGIYRQEGLVQFFDDPASWREVGYEVIDGDLDVAQNVTLKRRSESYPGYFCGEPLITPSDAVEIHPFQTKIDQYEWVAEQILHNTKEDELDPDDILVIFPNAVSAVSEFTKFRESLDQRELQSHLAGVTTSTDMFSKKGSITASGIYRAKGNEAPMVYIVNADWCASGTEMIKLRNTLFTAITRSKAWVRICGIGAGIEILKSEFDSVVNNKYSLKFIVPSEEELYKIRLINRDRSPEEKKKIKKAETNVKELHKLFREGALSPTDVPGLQEMLDTLKGIDKN